MGVKFRTTRPQDISHLYSETGSLRPDRIIAFVYRNRLPAGVARALLALAGALVRRESEKGNS